jgi:hypothetical protein
VCIPATLTVQRPDAYLFGAKNSLFGSKNSLLCLLGNLAEKGSELSPLDHVNRWIAG